MDDVYLGVVLFENPGWRILTPSKKRPPEVLPSAVHTTAVESHHKIAYCTHTITKAGFSNKRELLGAMARFLDIEAAKSGSDDSDEDEEEEFTVDDLKFIDHGKPQGVEDSVRALHATLMSRGENRPKSSSVASSSKEMPKAGPEEVLSSKTSLKKSVLDRLDSEDEDERRGPRGREQMEALPFSSDSDEEEEEKEGGWWVVDEGVQCMTRARRRQKPSTYSNLNPKRQTGRRCRDATGRNSTGPWLRGG